jgi:hypothetical protein
MARSGQITVTTGGTAVAGPDQVSDLVAFKADPDNTNPVFLGNDGAGDVTLDNGYPLEPGEQVIVQVSNLQDLRFDSVTDGEKIAWLLLD